jgi:hypothetical protein
MLTGPFADPRRRGVAVFGVMLTHTIGLNKNAKI